MAQSIRERVPDLAILKTIGFSDGKVTILVLAEAVVVFCSAVAGPSHDQPATGPEWSHWRSFPPPVHGAPAGRPGERGALALATSACPQRGPAPQDIEALGHRVCRRAPVALMTSVAGGADELRCVGSTRRLLSPSSPYAPSQRLGSRCDRHRHCLCWRAGVGLRWQRAFAIILGHWAPRPRDHATGRSDAGFQQPERDQVTLVAPLHGFYTRGIRPRH
jgi:hypothetical protein